MIELKRIYTSGTITPKTPFETGFFEIIQQGINDKKADEETLREQTQKIGLMDYLNRAYVRQRWCCQFSNKWKLFRMIHWEQQRLAVLDQKVQEIQAKKGKYCTGLEDYIKRHQTTFDGQWWHIQRNLMNAQGYELLTPYIAKPGQHNKGTFFLPDTLAPAPRPKWQRT